MNGASLVLGVAGVLAAGSVARGRSGDRNVADVDRDVRIQTVRQQGRGYRLLGYLISNPVRAFNDVAVDFLDENYWSFFDMDEPDEAEADREIWSFWSRLGVRSRDKVFALHLLEIEEPDARRKGVGSAAVRDLEASLRSMGVKAVILQAGQIYDTGHSLGFWEKMGYKVWPGDYQWYDDRIMYKVL